MRKVLLIVLVISIFSTMVITISYASQETSAKILFARQNGSIFELFTANADGTGERKMTTNVTVEEARLSPDGSKIAFVEQGTTFSNIYIKDGNGGPHEFVHRGFSVAFSPDGTKLAFVADGNHYLNEDIYIYDFATKQTTMLYNNDLGDIRELDWSPDGKKMIFTLIYDYYNANQSYIRQINTEGDPNPVALTSISEGGFGRTYTARQARYSPDGQKIAYTFWDEYGAANYHVYTMNLDGSNKTSISEAGFHAAFSVWSPDGNSILYSRNESAATRAELYTMNPDGTNNIQIAVNSTYEFPLDWKVYAPTNNALLKEIKVSGTAIPDFAEKEYAYNFKLPKGTTQIPEVTALAQDSKATVVLTNASALPGTATIKVTAADAVTSKTYTVNLSVIPDQGAAMTLGDYIQFGQYDGQPVLWRVINIDANGPLLFAKRTLTLKAFDASGDKTDGRGDNYRQQNGSGYWEKANIREWLNSQLAVVSYSHQQPDGVHVYSYYNDYANEPGFLYGFTAQERQAINQVNHKMLLSSFDTIVKEGGTAVHGFKESINTVVDNYDSAFYKNVTDQVFLLSVKELKQYVADRGWEYRAYPTAQAVANSEYQSAEVAADKYWHYWLRDPRADYSDSARTVNPAESFNGQFAYRGTVGVRPALYLKPEIRTLTGTGTLADPFVITGAVVPSAEATLSEIKVNGNPIQGFNPDTLVYNRTLPPGTEVAPDIIATAMDAKASVLITDASQLPGSTTITVTAEDGVTEKVYTINFSVAIQLSITTASLPIGTAGTPYNISLVASGGSESYNWSATGLPAGLRIYADGTISGTPGDTGTTIIEVTVIDSGNQSVSKNLTLTVALPDLAMLAAHYGQLVAGDEVLAQYDLTQDGVINLYDVVWVTRRLHR